MPTKSENKGSSSTQKPHFVGNDVDTSYSSFGGGLDDSELTESNKDVKQVKKDLKKDKKDKRTS